MKKLFLAIAILLVSINLMAQDNTPPVIETSFPDSGAEYDRTQSLCVSAKVSDAGGIFGTTFTIDPKGSIHWRPERNKKKYVLGVFIQSVSDPSKCFDISQLSIGSH